MYRVGDGEQQHALSLNENKSLILKIDALYLMVQPYFM